MWAILSRTADIAINPVKHALKLLSPLCEEPCGTHSETHGIDASKALRTGSLERHLRFPVCHPSRLRLFDETEHRRGVVAKFIRACLDHGERTMCARTEVESSADEFEIAPAVLRAKPDPG